MLKNKSLFILLFSISIFFFITISIVLVEFIYDKDLESLEKHILEEQKKPFQVLIDNDIKKLSSIILTIKENKKIAGLFAERDREGLYRETKNLFEQLKAEYKITHWYFLNTEKEATVFLRLHKKGLYGDKLPRATYWSAVRNKKMGAGLELGKTAYALRVVHPFYYKGELIGYIELARGIDEFFEIMKTGLSADYLVLTQKKFMNHNDWSEMANNTNNQHNWDKYDNFIRLSSTHAHCLNCRKIFDSQNLSDIPEKGVSFGTFHNKDRVYTRGVFPLIDAFGQKSGAVIYRKDITEFYNRAIFVKNIFFGLFGFLILTSIFITMQLITQRSKHEFNKIYKGITDNLWNEFIIIDPKTFTYKYLNKAVLENVGYEPEELLGKHISITVPEFLRNNIKVMEIVKPLITGEKRVVTYETCRRRKDGSCYPIQINFQYMEFENKPVLVAINRDLTNEKNRESIEQTIKEVFDRFWNELYIADANTLKITYVNKNAIDSLGYTFDEFLELTPGDIDLGFNEEIKNKYFSVIKDKEMQVTTESLYKRKDGTTYPVEININKGVFRNEQVIITVVRDITERKQHEKKILEAYKRAKSEIEAHLKEATSIISHSSSVAFTWRNTESWPVEFITENVEKVFGYKAEDFLSGSINYSDCIHPEDLPGVEKEIKDFINSGKHEFTHEPHRIITRAGEERIVSCWTYTVKDEEGNSSHFKGIVEDITEKRLAEIELSRSEQEKSLILSNIREAVIYRDTDSKIIWANRSASEKIGVSLEEMIGRTCSQVCTEKQFFCSKCPVRKALDFGIFSKAELENSKGRTWVVTVIPVKNDDDELIGVVETSLEITEQKRQELELKQKDKLLSAVTKATSDFLLNYEDFNTVMLKAFETIGQAFEVDRIYLFKNDPGKKGCPGKKRKEKYTADMKFEWISETSKCEINPEYAQGFSSETIPELFDNLLKNKPFIKLVKDMEPQTRNILEKQNILSVLIFPLFINNIFWGFIGFDECKSERTWTEIEKATFLSFVAIIAGVIEKNIKDKELLEQKQRAEEASKAKSEFLANMSHEIRTPMNGVIGFIDLLESTDLDEEQKDFVEEAKKSSKQLLEVINDILDFSKIEAGKMTMEKINFNVRSIVEDLATLTNAGAQDKKIEVNALVYSDVPKTLIGDPGRLKQVINNLTNNALKFTHEGEIFICVKKQEEDESTVTLKFTVSDTGIGIAQDKLKLIFESFAQADTSATRKYSGTGLGLTICKKIVNLLKGSICVESEVGKGSVFTFTSVFKKTEASYENGNGDTKNLKGKNILIVDDIPTNVRVAGYYLESAGCNVFRAESSKGAVDILENNENIDLIISDYRMPEKDGINLASELKSSEKYNHIPIILLTSFVHRGGSKLAQSLGFSGYLTKPVKKDDLIKGVSIALNDKFETKEFITRHVIRENNFNERYSILLVEDNEINQKLTVKLLNKNGFNCDIASNGQEAIDICKKKDYDLILMDCQMPVMDGYEATKQIREIKKDKKIPIIAMTAHSFQEDIEKCFSSGMDDYLSKPVDGEKLINMLKKYLTLLEISKQTGISQKEAEELLDEFMEKLPEKISRLARAVSEENFDEIIFVSHDIKGASANLRQEDLSELAYGLEETAKSKDIILCRTLLEKIKTFI